MTVDVERLRAKLQEVGSIIVLTRPEADALLVAARPFLNPEAGDAPDGLEDVRRLTNSFVQRWMNQLPQTFVGQFVDGLASLARSYIAAERKQCLLLAQDTGTGFGVHPGSDWARACREVARKIEERNNVARRVG